MVDGGDPIHLFANGGNDITWGNPNATAYGSKAHVGGANALRADLPKG